MYPSIEEESSSSSPPPPPSDREGFLRSCLATPYLFRPLAYPPPPPSPPTTK
jgi:hypothetical protein